MIVGLRMANGRPFSLLLHFLQPDSFIRSWCPASRTVAWKPFLGNELLVDSVFLISCFLIILPAFYTLFLLPWITFAALFTQPALRENVNLTEP